MITVTNFSKQYKGFTAVKDLSFSVEPGQILGLLGPNGAGKTTTLRTLCGIIPPTSGRLLIAGHDIAEAPIAAKQNIGYIPDDPRLFDTMTVWEHLAFTAAAYKVADFEESAEALLMSFELTHKRDTLVHNLSRGMRQKVAIACAFLHDPKVILFDEPLTGLDPQGIRGIKQAIRERAQAGAAIIISSHLLSLFEDLCTHIMVLNLGECRLFGTMGSVLSEFGQNDDSSALEEAYFTITQNKEMDQA
ncbi:ABC-2 type transport system ATP-binding protein [Aliiroseovarius halocynthiae]|uniref:ABC transporter ATP-binding protein n=1 Tax=Aliiroseovarius halocynthiae TaxID=985055 RepID=A0A545SSL7_9RHOB|nr:ABC transporter ATP-binding protein [Aliiroseovarius halocynthiae]TQV67968.1 ABC transporter ATP-binding protein [Aliiroseovarius halocynthiae]SMR73057.1 ABC-2 type transport system ATP-binding protein [Aliiroseovarius halocynthiae]